MNNKQTAKTKSKRNPGAKEDKNLKIEDWERKLVVGKYLESYTTYNEDTKA